MRRPVGSWGFVLFGRARAGVAIGGADQVAVAFQQAWRRHIRLGIARIATQFGQQGGTAVQGGGIR